MRLLLQERALVIVETVAVLPKLVLVCHFAPQLVGQMCLECRTHIQSMATGTALLAASILEMTVHPSADVFALCC